MAQESFMDIFSELIASFSIPSPSFNRWIKRISDLEGWTSYTYPWWTMYKTRSSLFFLKRGFRQNWGLSHLSQCRKINRRNLVVDSHTEQFLRSRGLRQKQTFPHLVSQHQKTTWGSLSGYSLTEQIISSNIVSNRRRKNVLPFVRVYHEKISDRNCFFFVHNTVILTCSVLFVFFNRWLFFTTLFVSSKLRLLFCQLKGEEKLINKVVVAFYKNGLNQLRQTFDTLDASGSFQWNAIWERHKSSARHRQVLEQMIERFIFTTELSTRKTY